PAAELADRGMSHDALLDAFSAALAFSPEGDEEVDRLQELLRTEPAHVVATEVTGLTPDAPAFAAVLKRITIHHPATRAAHRSPATSAARLIPPSQRHGSSRRLSPPPHPAVPAHRLSDQLHPPPPAPPERTHTMAEPTATIARKTALHARPPGTFAKAPE